MIKVILFSFIIIFLKVLSFEISNLTSRYNGENFPIEYLKVDSDHLKHTDLIFFIKTLKRTVSFLTKRPNNTDCNVAIGTYLMTCILRKTLLDDSIKMTPLQVKSLKDILSKGYSYVSHYVYNNRLFGFRDLEYRVSVLYKDVDVFVHSMNTFNEKRLHKWIFSDFIMHPYIQIMDNVTLNKDTYIEILESMDKFHVNMSESDICLSRVIETPEPVNTSHWQRCRRDDYCLTSLLSEPSVGYALSHRLLNMLFRSHVRHCYLQSYDKDVQTADQLCAFMFREAVFLARRGYFARDIFLEHVALCAILGYKEFYRLHWFYKAASWINEDGCMQENWNFDINRTRIYKAGTNNTKKQIRYSKSLKKMLLKECQLHPMTLSTVVLAHAIRYVAHFM